MAEERDPLWQVMDDAYDADTPYRQCYANMIRALRDWLVPEEKAQPMMRGPDLERLCQRQDLRAQLTSEAERTETVR